MIDGQNLLQSIEEIVVDVAQIDAGFDYKKDLYADIGVESINSLAILMTLEEKFEIAIEDTDFVQSRTVEKLAQLVGRLTA